MIHCVRRWVWTGTDSRLRHLLTQLIYKFQCDAPRSRLHRKERQPITQSRFCWMVQRMARQFRKRLADGNAFLCCQLLCNQQHIIVDIQCCAHRSHRVTYSRPVNSE